MKLQKILNVFYCISSPFDNSNNAAKIIIKKDYITKIFDNIDPKIPIANPLSAIFRAITSLLVFPLNATTFSFTKGKIKFIFNF